MAVLVIGYLHDQPFADLAGLIAGNQLGDFGYKTEVGPWQKRGFGTLCSGSVRSGKEHRTFSYVRLDKDVGALGVAVKIGYTSRNSVLVASAIKEQVAIMRKNKIGIDGGCALFVRTPVPMLSEYGNALLIVGNPDSGELAATVFRRFVFSETVSRKPFVLKTAVSRGIIHDISCVEECHV